MDNFELYMIDNIKSWSDKLRNNKNDNELSYMIKNVLDELTNVFVQYRNSKE